MAKSFIRNFTDQITGSNAKTTDTEVVQAVSHFVDEQSKLSKFKREFDKYVQATLVFDNASYHFFGFIRSLADLSWSHQQTLDRLCLDIARIRSEYLQYLNKEMHSSSNLLSEKFDQMKGHIDEQNRVQSDYDKTRRQYNASIKREEQFKIDRIKLELDQLKSALSFTNKTLRDDLVKFHTDVQRSYTKTIVEFFDMHGNFHLNFHKLCSSFIEKIKVNETPTLDYNQNDFDKVMQSSSIENLRKKKSSRTSAKKTRRTDYKILHQARVIHDYEAEYDDEINLVKGEYISVISFDDQINNERDDRWEYAEKSDGTIGLFPVNFAVRLYDNEVDDSRK